MSKYLVAPSYASLLGCGATYLRTILLVSEDGSLPTQAYIIEVPYHLRIMGITANHVLIPVDNLTPEFSVDGEGISAKLTFGGRITPGGGYYCTNSTKNYTMLIDSAFGNCVYKSAPTRFPVRFAHNGVNYGDKYYKGVLPQGYADDEADTIKEWTGEWDSSEKCNVQAIRYGWWEKKDKETPLYGAYIGRGLYKGRFMIVGSATWLIDNQPIIRNAPADTLNSYANYGDFIYDKSSNLWWLNGDKPSGNQAPEEDRRYECIEKLPVVGKNIEIKIITYIAGIEEPTITYRTANWSGYSADENNYDSFVCETPAWRE